MTTKRAKPQHYYSFSSQIVPVTFFKWLTSSRFENPIATPKLVIVLRSLESAIKTVALLASRARINRLDQRSEDDCRFTKQEVMANTVVLRALQASRLVSLAISTVSPFKVMIDDVQGTESYIVCYNPLEGAQLPSSIITMGLIFSIYKKIEKKDLDDINCGNDMIAAGFALFATCVTLIISIGKKGVQEFVYDPVLGDFIAKNLSVTIPVRGRYYCVDEARSTIWNPAVSEFIQRKKNPTLGKLKHFSYIGCLCADTYRTLKDGGVLLHPETPDEPRGIVKLLCEGNPLSYLIRVAGGLASTGNGSPLDVAPKPLHRTIPLYMGSREDVIDLLEILTIRKATSCYKMK